MAEENKYNIKIECGADFVLPFTWYDYNGMPVDLTGATVEAQLRETSSSPHSFDLICSHNGKGGRIVLVLPAEATKEISYSYGTYDVYVNLPSGGRKRPLYGDVRIQDHVTKPIDGALLYLIGVEDLSDLPDKGLYNRIYFVYRTGEYYRWNGTNYILTGISSSRIAFAAFYIDIRTGHLFMRRQDWYEKPAFALNEITGHLYVRL